MAGAIRRGDIGAGSRQDLDQGGLSERARLVRAAFDALAAQLRSAA